MFKDLSLSIDKNKINFEYTNEDDKLIIKPTDELKENSILKIFYDENIYEIKLNKETKFDLGKAGEIYVHINNKEFSFSVILKNNYFVKSVYKYINKLITKDILIEEIKLFLSSKAGKKYNKDINDLLLSIENNKDNEYKRISNLLTSNKTYLNIVRNMSDLELMLLITSYIYVPNVPKINQESFNDLINVAKSYDHNLENIWRLGMNYDCKGYDYDLLDEFFVNSKDIWYLGEYINGVHQANQENIVNKIIKIGDKEYIKQLLEDNSIVDNLDKKYIDILERNI